MMTTRLLLLSATFAFISGALGAAIGAMLFGHLVGMIGASALTTLVASSVGWIMLEHTNVGLRPLLSRAHCVH